MIQTSMEWKQQNPEKAKADKRKQHLKYYGLNEKGFQSILETQGFRCALCGEMFGDSFEKRTKYIDHNHETGFVRGILHPKCNTLLGMANDDVTRLKQAINYLETRS